MPALPGTPRTWVAGEYPTAAQLNAEIKDSVNFLNGAPAARAYHSIAQSIGNAAWTIVAFNSERFDNYAMHDNATNNSRITVVTGGVYLLTTRVSYAANGTGTRLLDVYQSGLSVDTFGPIAGNGTHGNHLAMTTVSKAVAGDYFQVATYQDSTVALNVTAATFSAVRISAG